MFILLTELFTACCSALHSNARPFRFVSAPVKGADTKTQISVDAQVTCWTAARMLKCSPQIVHPNRATITE